MDALMGVGCWLPMPRFQHLQPNGKKRPIDDGKRNHHNMASGYTETLDCVSAMQPAVHVSALVRVAQRKGISPTQLAQHSVETGGEDIPDAYRWVPSAPREAHVNVVGIYSSEVQDARYQVIYGQVFGKSSAVIAFHRIQRFLQSLPRRWLALLLSLYFDDGTLQDLSVARGRGQRYMRALYRMIGVPLSTEKQTNLTSTCDFLGLVHDVTDCLRTGTIHFRPRDRLKEKCQDILMDRLVADTCTPAEAKKITGTLGFEFTGYYGKVGRGGQHALIQRQYSDRAPWALSKSLRKSLRYLYDLQSCNLHREVSLYRPNRKPIVIASDGRLDETAPPSIGVVLVDPEDGAREAVVGYVPDVLVQKWSVKEQYIALVEQSAIALGIDTFKHRLRNRDVIWFEDNAVVLSGMVKGRCHCPEVDDAMAALHLAFAMLRTRVWYEYVESDANWSDGPSRELSANEWLVQEGFSVHTTDAPAWPWLVSPEDRVTVLAGMLGA